MKFYKYTSLIILPTCDKKGRQWNCFFTISVCDLTIYVVYIFQKKACYTSQSEDIKARTSKINASHTQLHHKLRIFFFSFKALAYSSH